MKKNMVLSGLVCSTLLLSGCLTSIKKWVPGKGKKADQTVEQKKKKLVEIPLAEGNKKSMISYFDDADDIEAFVLDQHDSPHFAGNVKRVAQGSATDVSDDFVLAEPVAVPENEKEVLYFDYDSHAIRKDQQGTFKRIKDKVAQWTKQGKQIVFKGHSCLFHGTPAYNVAISNQRSNEIAKQCGVTSDQIKAFGVGNEEPVVFEYSKEAQSPNRRVEVYAITV